MRIFEIEINNDKRIIDSLTNANSRRSYTLFDLLRRQSNDFTVKATSFLYKEDIELYIDLIEEIYNDIKDLQAGDIARFLLKWLDPY